MKKIFLFLSAAVLMAVSCIKSETVYTQQPNELGFRVFSGNITKGAELTGTILPNTYGIYTAATQKNASGLIENPSFFANVEQLFGTEDDDPGAAGPDNRLWHAGSYAAGTFTPSPLYWPIGGVKMDFLSYAMRMASREGVLAGDWKADWDNYRTDAASQVSFKDVDTYANQEDVMYAYANGQTSGANAGSGKSVHLEFNHAQAMLIFNVRVNAEEVKDKINIHEISFVTPERIEALRAYQNAVAAYDDAEHAAWQAIKDAHDAWVSKKAAHDAWQDVKDAHDAWQAIKDTHDAWVTKKADDGYEGMDDGAKEAWDAANPEPPMPGVEPDAPGVEPEAPGDEPAVPGPEPSGAPVLADLVDDDVILKTVGTFTVNNSRNILQAGWTYKAQTDPKKACVKENYRMPLNAITAASDSNSEVDAKDTYFTNYGAAMGKYDGEHYYQLGDILLIPEQDKVNFTIEYEVGGKTMFYTFNDVRGVWEKGKKYMYNLDLTLNEIVITENVVDYVAAPATPVVL